MGSLRWTAGSGDWSMGANWSVVSGTDAIPQSGDDATIAAPTNYVVTVSDQEFVNNLTIGSVGAQVSVTGTLTATGMVSQLNGTLQLSGGVLQGGTYSTSAPAVILGTGTLDGVTIRGPLAIGNVGVRNGLTLRAADGLSPGLATVADFTSLTFLDSETLDNATITLAANLQGAHQAALSVSAGNTLTLGPNLVVNSNIFRGNTNLGGAGVVINRGTIVANSGGGSFGFSAADFRNEGLIQVADSGGSTGAFNLTNNGLVVIGAAGIGGGGSSGALSVTGSLSGTGTLLLGDGVTASQYSLLNVGSVQAGVLIVRNSGTAAITATAIDPAATFDRFAAGSQFDLRNVAFSGSVNANYVGTQASGTLIVSENGLARAAIHLTNVAANQTFTVQSDSQASPGTIVRFAACFVTGTRIRTVDGDVAVERLRVGDVVPALRAGCNLPILWIGQRSLSLVDHLSRRELWPVRVAAGAFADGVPLRDLWLSPEHAVFAQGALVPIKLLINGASILQCPRHRVTYWHVELARHDLIVSEGMPSESYLDTGNRSDFENGGPAIAMHPEFANEVWNARACLEQIRDVGRLRRVRGALIERAVRLGYFYDSAMDATVAA